MFSKRKKRDLLCCTSPLVISSSVWSCAVFRAAVRVMRPLQHALGVTVVSIVFISLVFLSFDVTWNLSQTAPISKCYDSAVLCCRPTGGCPQSFCQPSRMSGGPVRLFPCKAVPSTSHCPLLNRWHYLTWVSCGSLLSRGRAGACPPYAVPEGTLWCQSPCP